MALNFLEIDKDYNAQIEKAQKQAMQTAKYR
jgi:hypothetical protein